MVTQILYGEHFEIREQMVGWSNVKLAYDDYEGWIDSKMITVLSACSLNKLENSPYAVSGDIFSIIP